MSSDNSFHEAVIPYTPSILSWLPVTFSGQKKPPIDFSLYFCNISKYLQLGHSMPACFSVMAHVFLITTVFTVKKVNVLP